MYVFTNTAVASSPPDVLPCCFLVRDAAAKECSSITHWPPAHRYPNQLLHTHTHSVIWHRCTTHCIFIQLIFLAAVAFNWSHSGPLPWPSADERTHSLLHYPLSFQGCWQWSWERTVKDYYGLTNWKLSHGAGCYCNSLPFGDWKYGKFCLFLPAFSCAKSTSHSIWMHFVAPSTSCLPLHICLYTMASWLLLCSPTLHPLCNYCKCAGT